MKSIKKFMNSKLAMILLPIIVFACILGIPTPDTLSATGQKALALVVMGILFFSFSPISLTILVPLIVLLQVPLHISTINEAMIPFTGPVFIYILSMLCLAVCFENSGLTKRIALFAAIHSHGNPKKLLFRFITVAALSSTLVADIPVLVMLVPICLAIIEKNGINATQSNFAQALLIGIASGCFIGGMGTPAGSAANPLTQQILASTCSIRLSFMEWSLIGIPAVVLLIPCLYFSLTFFLPPELSKIAGMEEMRKEYDELGQLSRKEKSFLIIFGLTVVLWFTDRIHNIPVQLISLVSVAIFSLPWLSIFNWQRDHARINWDVIMLVGGAASFGEIVSKTGVAAWFAQEWLAPLVHLPILLLFACIVLIMIFSQFPFPATVGAVAAIAPALIVIAQTKGINPAGVLLTMALGGAAPILSPAICFYPIINATGVIRYPNVWKGGVLACLAEVIVIVAIMFTLGKMLGFMQ